MLSEKTNTSEPPYYSKRVLTFDEAAAYTGISKSGLYKLTSRGDVPHYKPRGKMLYFEREELENWLLQGKVSSSAEIDQRANEHLLSAN